MNQATIFLTLCVTVQVGATLARSLTMKITSDGTDQQVLEYWEMKKNLSESVFNTDESSKMLSLSSALTALISNNVKKTLPPKCLLRNISKITRDQFWGICLTLSSLWLSASTSPPDQRVFLAIAFRVRILLTSATFRLYSGAAKEAPIATELFLHNRTSRGNSS